MRTIYDTAMVYFPPGAGLRERVNFAKERGLKYICGGYVLAGGTFCEVEIPKEKTNDENLRN